MQLLHHEFDARALCHQLLRYALATVVALSLVAFCAGVVHGASVPASVTPQASPPTSVATATLTAAQVDAIVQAQTTAYLRYVITTRCATVQCTPIIAPTTPPPSTAPTFKVGYLNISAGGVYSGQVVPAAASVLVYFDGSQVQHVLNIKPSGGSFSGQLDASLQDGTKHTLQAYAVMSGDCFNVMPSCVKAPLDPTSATSFTWPK